MKLLNIRVGPVLVPAWKVRTQPRWLVLVLNASSSLTCIVNVRSGLFGEVGGSEPEYEVDGVWIEVISLDGESRLFRISEILIVATK